MPHHQPKKPKKNTNQIRIIGGTHRGRKLPFPDAQGLRPTPDRIRETLFNWLQGYIAGAHCVDLFAGSGLLGFEALSRGAAHALFVEYESTVAGMIRDNIALLKATDIATVMQADAMQLIGQLEPASVDIVFLDPPYGKGLVAESVKKLHDSQCLKPGALLYLEQESSLPDPELPEEWQILKRKQAGQVGYYLIQTVQDITNE